MWTEVWSGECQFDVALPAGRGKEKFCVRQLCSKILTGLVNTSPLEFLKMLKPYMDLGLFQCRGIDWVIIVKYPAE